MKLPRLRCERRGCELALTHEGVLPDYGERTKEGWATILGNLEKSIV